MGKIKRGLYCGKRGDTMLTSEQVKQNQKRYGFNELEEGKRKSVVRIFLEQFKDFLVLILLFLLLFPVF